MIYLASPYSHKDPEVMLDRFRRVCVVAGRLMEIGEIVFSPIAHTHPIALACGLSRGFDYWKRFDEEFISVSHKLVVVTMQGWRESLGVQAEIKIAVELGKRVLFIEEYGSYYTEVPGGSD
jgi:hypothetical protein